MIRSLAIILFFLLSHSLWSQKFYAAYEKALSNYNNEQNIAYDITYVSAGKTKLIDKTTMHVEYIDGISYTELEEIQSFNFDSTSVIIDNTNRRIQLNVGVKVPQTGIQSIEGVKELIQLATRESEQKKEQEKWYTLHFDQGDFSSISMVVNPKTGAFKKMTYQLTQPLVNIKVEDEEPLESLEIIFNNYQENKTAFSLPLEEVLHFDGQRFSLQKKYSTYQFVNNYDLH